MSRCDYAPEFKLLLKEHSFSVGFCWFFHLSEVNVKCSVLIFSSVAELVSDRPGCPITSNSAGVLVRCRFVFDDMYLWMANCM